MFKTQNIVFHPFRIAFSYLILLLGLVTKINSTLNEKYNWQIFWVNWDRSYLDDSLFNSSRKVSRNLGNKSNLLWMENFSSSYSWGHGLSFKVSKCISRWIFYVNSDGEISSTHQGIFQAAAKHLWWDSSAYHVGSIWMQIKNINFNPKAITLHYARRSFVLAGNLLHKFFEKCSKDVLTLIEI